MSGFCVILGTISAANSCPTSPRQGFHDFGYNSSHTGSHTTSNYQNVSVISLLDRAERLPR
jgi:hypothetical protein